MQNQNASSISLSAASTPLIIKLIKVPTNQQCIFFPRLQCNPECFKLLPSLRNRNVGHFFLLTLYFRPNSQMLPIQAPYLAPATLTYRYQLLVVHRLRDHSLRGLTGIKIHRSGVSLFTKLLAPAAGFERLVFVEEIVEDVFLHAIFGVEELQGLVPFASWQPAYRLLGMLLFLPQ
jgi:hypothetical protein